MNVRKVEQPRRKNPSGAHCQCVPEKCTATGARFPGRRRDPLEVIRLTVGVGGQEVRACGRDVPDAKRCCPAGQSLSLSPTLPEPACTPCAPAGTPKAEHSFNRIRATSVTAGELACAPADEQGIAARPYEMLRQHRDRRQV